MLPWLTSLIMVGHVSTADLAALSLVEVWVYTFLEITWTGISVTLSVLVSQAHGRKSILAMRGWACMSIIVMLFCSVILALLCVFASETLYAFGFDKDISERGGVFSKYIIPALFTEGINVCLSAYLTAFQFAAVPTILQLLSSVLDVLITYVFIFGLGDFVPFIDALKGSALAWICSSSFTIVLITLYTWCIWGSELRYCTDDDNSDRNGTTTAQGHYKKLAPCETTAITITDKSNHTNDKTAQASITANANDDINESESTLSPRTPLLYPDGNDFVVFSEEGNSRIAPVLDALGVATEPISGPADKDTGEASCIHLMTWISSWKRWNAFARIAGPNFLTIGFQCFSFFVMSFLAAKLGVVQIATHNINIALFEVLFTVVQGMSEATTIRIGYHVGGRNVAAAKNTIAIAFVIGSLWGVAVGMGGYIFRHEIAFYLSSDSAVVEESVHIAPYLYGAYALLSIGNQALAILDGQGRSTQQAACFFVGTWLVGVPLFILSFTCTSYGLRGLWGSLLIGYVVSEGLAVSLVCTSDWSQIVEDANTRVEVEYTDEHDLSETTE